MSGRIAIVGIQQSKIESPVSRSDCRQRYFSTHYYSRTTRRAAALVLLAALMCGRLVEADDNARSSATAANDTDYQDLLFLDDDRPIVIRLQLFVDGRPFVSVWQDFVRRLFQLADRNGDGELSADETGSPAQSDDALSEELFSILTLPGVAQADIHPPDGALSFSEFLALIRSHRGGPFQAPPFGGSAGKAQGQTVPTGQSTTPGSILFETLDVDRDGQISRSEIQTGSESIRQFDFDGDGASSLDELDHTRSPFGRAAPTLGEATGVPVLSLDRPSRELIQTLVSTYGEADARGSASLAVTKLGMPDEQNVTFDADGDGQLDRDELRYWLTHPEPHVELIVRVGNRDEAVNSVTVTMPPTLEGLSIKSNERGLVSLVCGDVHLEFGINPDRRNAESLRHSFTQRFEQADRDSNGYLEKKEVANNTLFEESFRRFDRDGDGKVIETELLSIVEVEIIAGLSRTGMTAANRGKDMFEILDTNRDRRVSRRELLGAVDRFDLWDTDSDDRLAEDEVPQLYQLIFDRGTPRLPGSAATEFRNSFARSGTDGASTNDDAPVWFHKMDRNGDGDVSRQEFLDTPLQFGQWDADGNGLIDVMEGRNAAPAR